MNLIYSMLRPIAERYPELAKLYRDYRSSRSLNKTPRPIPLGFQFIGNPAMETGTFEPNETAVIQENLKVTDVFINVGANIGYYCCIALHSNIPTVAFEPIDLNLKYLYKNISANNWQEDIEIFPVAMGDRSGMIEIYGGGTGASLIKGWSGTPTYYRQWVPVSTLDNVIGSRFKGKQCLILVDVEGAELMLLKGACDLLSLDPAPTWIVEICITEHQPEGIKVNPDLLETFNLFWELGYHTYTCSLQERRVERSEIEAIQETGKNTLKTHNFIFRKPDKN